MAILVILLWPDLSAVAQPDDPPAEVLTAAQQRRLDSSLGRALRWIVSQQHADGSFSAPTTGQPAIASFAVLAFLSAGYLPGDGPYGDQIDRAIDYVLSCQKRDGLLSRNVPESNHVGHGASHTAMYNHGIAGVMLSEVCGMAAVTTNRRMTHAIERALAFTATIQDRPDRRPIDKGAWRYLHRHPEFDSDLSITSWHLMFYRSARNAGFDVSSERIDRAVRYVVACFDSREQCFRYHPHDTCTRRAMSGAGILALTHGGQFDHRLARQAGDWLLAHPYRDYNAAADANQWFHYGLFYTVPAMYMLGGRHWEQFFPVTVDTILRHQQTDGSWPPEPDDNVRYGNVYTTALVVTALNTPNQLLPIMQR